MLEQQYPSLSDLTDIFILEGIKGFGPKKFKELHSDGIAPSDLISRPYEMQRFGKRGKDFRSQLETLTRSEGRRDAEARAKKQLDVARQNNASILIYGSEAYPRALYSSNNPVPVLYARGNLRVAKSDKAVACVGSRNIRPPYFELHQSFALEAVGLGHTIVSGFATGADIIGHLAARSAENGTTICVMPSGLDRPFPPEHKEIWRDFVGSERALFVSEFGFGVGASSLNLRKRNKTIVALVRGVLVSQSSEEGGAMNAYRFAIEQKKPIATFAADGTNDTSGNDLIAGSAEKVRSTVLGHQAGDDWANWLRSL